MLSFASCFAPTGLTLTVDDLTWLSSNHVRVPLPGGKHELVDVFSALVHLPYVTTNLRTLAKVEHVATPQSTFHHDSSYVVPVVVDTDGLSLTPSKIGLVTQRKYELIHFGYMAQWESFRGATISRQLFLQEDTSSPRRLFYHPPFTASDYSLAWMLIKGYTCQLCGETPIDLRMGVPAPTTNYNGMSVTLTTTKT
jgi:hypothetical protein